MSKQYKLYLVLNINDIFMLSYVDMTWARNIVEAESIFEPKMSNGSEYQITISK